jgi:CheY-like chemotaxis protein
VLVVDDDRVSRHVIATCLAELGLANPVDELADGATAIAWLRRCLDHADVPLPVLLLLDLRMPGTSGRDVLLWMREIPELAAVPVIVLTADDEAESVVALYRLGVRSYLVKPVGFAALATVIRDLDAPWMLT